MERRPCGWCVLVLGMVFVLFALVSCGGRGGVSIAVAPSAVMLAPGESQVFTATVMGAAGTGVRWSSSGGELVASGMTATFVAPAEVGEYVVTASSAADNARWASATVSVIGVNGELSVGSEGGIVAGVDGVSLIVPRGVVEEGEALMLAVDRSAAPTLALPEDVQVLGSHYLFQVHRVLGSASNEAGANDVATASLDGLVIAMPVPEDADRERLALGVLVPSTYVMGGGPSEWVFVEGVLDGDRDLLLGSVYRVPAEGLSIVLVEHADAATVSSRSQSARDGGAVSRTAVPPAGTWLSSFTVTAVGARAESVRTEYEEYLASLVDVFRDGGFHPFLLSSAGRTFDFESWSWNYSHASYEVTVKEYQDVPILLPWPLSPTCSRDTNTGATTAAGVYNPITASITLCTYGTLNSSARQTGIHELFHASQFGSPAVARVSWDVLGHRLWIFEGTAALSERSIVNDGFAIERGARTRRPVDVPLQSSGDANRYEYRAQDVFAYLGDRVGEDFRYVRHLFAEGPSVQDFEVVLGQRYGLTWADVYEGWVRHQIEEVSQNCTFLEGTLIPNARLLNFHDGATGDSSFVVGSLDTRAAIITLVNRDPERTFEWGLSFHHQDGRSRSRLYAMDPSSTTGCLTPVSSGPHAGESVIGVSAGPNEVRRLLLIVPHVETWDRISSGFLRVVDHGYGSSPPVNVSVEPSSVTLPVNGTESFTATVSGAADTSVAWSATCGSLTASGLTATYTAPSTQGTCIVTVASVDDSNATANAVVTVAPPNAPPTILSFTATPSVATVGEPVTFSWSVSDADDDPLACSLDVDGNGAGDYEISDCRASATQVHTYAASGTFAPALSVSDGRGGVGQEATSVTIQPGAGSTRFTTLAAGSYSSFALDSSGNAWSWGSDNYGQLGDGGSNANKSSPVEVVMPAGVTFSFVAPATGAHSLALDSSGNAWSWGSNNYGQLGDGGTNANRSTPVPIVMPAGVTFTTLAAGAWHSLALDSNGNAWAWGRDHRGQLGDGGTNTDTNTPVQVIMPAGVTFVALAAGTGHSLAIDSNGNGWAWGYNWWGQLGYGGSANTTTPVQVVMAAGVTFTTVAAGESFSLALDTTGNGWAWGYNGYGQIGDGSTLTRRTPVQVAMPASVTFASLGAGRHHSLALDSDGNAWGWGRNYSGQLGDGGTNEDSSMPVQVAMPAGVTFAALDAGYYHSLALDGVGNAWAWGSDHYGALGDGGTNANQSTPVPVAMP